VFVLIFFITVDVGHAWSVRNQNLQTWFQRNSESTQETESEKPLPPQPKSDPVEMFMEQFRFVSTWVEGDFMVILNLEWIRRESGLRLKTKTEKREFVRRFNGKKMKVRALFDESSPDEITLVAINPEIPEDLIPKYSEQLIGKIIQIHSRSRTIEIKLSFKEVLEMISLGKIKFDRASRDEFLFRLESDTNQKLKAGSYPWEVTTDFRKRKFYVIQKFLPQESRALSILGFSPSLFSFLNEVESEVVPPAVQIPDAVHFMLQEPQVWILSAFLGAIGLFWFGIRYSKKRKAKKIVINKLKRIYFSNEIDLGEEGTWESYFKEIKELALFSFAQSFINQISDRFDTVSGYFPPREWSVLALKALGEEPPSSSTDPKGPKSPGPLGPGGGKAAGLILSLSPFLPSSDANESLMAGFSLTNPWVFLALLTLGAIFHFFVFLSQKKRLEVEEKTKKEEKEREYQLKLEREFEALFDLFEENDVEIPVRDLTKAFYEERFLVEIKFMFAAGDFEPFVETYAGKLFLTGLYLAEFENEAIKRQLNETILPLMRELDDPWAYTLRESDDLKVIPLLPETRGGFLPGQAKKLSGRSAVLLLALVGQHMRERGLGEGGDKGVDYEMLEILIPKALGHLEEALASGNDLLARQVTIAILQGILIFQDVPFQMGSGYSPSKNYSIFQQRMRKHITLSDTFLELLGDRKSILVEAIQRFRIEMSLPLILWNDILGWGDMVKIAKHNKQKPAKKRRSLWGFATGEFDYEDYLAPDILKKHRQALRELKPLHVYLGFEYEKEKTGFKAVFGKAFKAMLEKSLTVKVIQKMLRRSSVKKTFDNIYLSAA